jgi:thymidine kinase
MENIDFQTPGIYGVIGTMFGGKTSTIKNIAERLSYKKNIREKVLVINSVKDKGRLTSKSLSSPKDLLSCITTHSGEQYPSVMFDDDNIPTDLDYYDKYDIIIIDELHLFPINVEEILIKLRLIKMKIIIYSCLTADATGKMFSVLTKILPFTRKIIQRNALCMECDLGDGLINIRKVNAENESAIGAENNYESICENCFQKYMKENGLMAYCPKENKFVHKKIYNLDDLLWFNKF